MFPGLGYDGGLAEFVNLRQELLVDRGDLSAELSAPLPDAGATAYRAVRHARKVLTPGETVVVIGVGVLGTSRSRILEATTNANVIAVDVRQEGLDLASRLGLKPVFCPVRMPKPRSSSLLVDRARPSSTARASRPASSLPGR